MGRTRGSTKPPLIVVVCLLVGIPAAAAASSLLHGSFDDYWVRLGRIAVPAVITATIVYYSRGKSRQRK